MTRRRTVIVFAALLAFPWLAVASMKSMVETASYAMGDNDSRNCARDTCTSSTKRTALD